MEKDLVIASVERKTAFTEVYKSAIKKLLNQILIDRNNDKLYTLLGFCYKKTGKISKALNNFEKAILINNGAFSAFYQMGLCGLKTGKTCVAVNSFVNAIKSKPTSSNAVLNLGISHELCEEPDMAFLIYDKLIETTPNFLKGYEKKAELFMKMSLYSEAIPLLNEIISKNPNDFKAFNNLANCYKKLGKNSYAYRCYKKILSTNPSEEVYANTVAELIQINKLSIGKPVREKLRLC